MHPFKSPGGAGLEDDFHDVHCHPVVAYGNHPNQGQVGGIQKQKKSLLILDNTIPLIRNVGSRPLAWTSAKHPLYDYEPSPKSKIKNLSFPVHAAHTNPVDFSKCGDNSTDTNKIQEFPKLFFGGFCCGPCFGPYCVFVIVD